MILALESSCDETALAIFDPALGVACEWIHSQVELHSGHGGVVPDIATREHLRAFGPLLERARVRPEWGAIDRGRRHAGPGARRLPCRGSRRGKGGRPRDPRARRRREPPAGPRLVAVHSHPRAVARRVRRAARRAPSAPGPHRLRGQHDPLLPLRGPARSGGISSTRDDAAGEALDKGAKLLGLGYPGGPEIERLAPGGRADAYDFPRGIGKRGDLDFSFSGLKTSLRYRVQAMPEAEVRAALPDLCASYQAAVVDALAGKTAGALARGCYRSVGLSGGVANNQRLRAAMAAAAAESGAQLPGRRAAAHGRQRGDDRLRRLDGRRGRGVPLGRGPARSTLAAYL